MKLKHRESFFEAEFLSEKDRIDYIRNKSVSYLEERC